VLKHFLLRFYGRVQGIGFRAEAKRCALELKLYGYARNLPDGSVEVVLQASKEECDGYIALIKSRFQNGYVERVECSSIRSGLFTDFQIVH
jgi:acylphosphatase